MTVEERMETIRNKGQKNIDEAQAKADAKRNELNELCEKVRDMGQRVKDLCKLANTCIENNIQIPCKTQFSSDYDSGKKWGYPYEFIAEGIRHHVGFFTPKREWKNGIQVFTEPFRYIGIKNGGACGVWDFRTDGDIVQSISNTDYDRGKISEPRKRDLEQFIKEFPQFEAAFLKWIDSLGE